MWQLSKSSRWTPFRCHRIWSSIRSVLLRREAERKETPIWNFLWMFHVQDKIALLLQIHCDQEHDAGTSENESLSWCKRPSAIVWINEFEIRREIRLCNYLPTFVHRNHIYATGSSVYDGIKGNFEEGRELARWRDSSINGHPLPEFL